MRAIFVSVSLVMVFLCGSPAAEANCGCGPYYWWHHHCHHHHCCHHGHYSSWSPYYGYGQAVGYQTAYAGYYSQASYSAPVQYANYHHPHHHHHHCHCSKDQRSVYYGSGGIIIIEPAVPKFPRKGHAALRIGGAIVSMNLLEIINGPDGCLYYEIHQAPPIVPHKSLIKICCDHHGKISIFIRFDAEVDYKLVMHAHLQCEPGYPLPYGGKDEREYGPAGTMMDEFGPMPPGGPSSARTRPQPVRVVRKKGEEVVSRERRAALTWDETSVAARPSPKSRAALEGRWFAPAETKIVARWSDDAAPKSKPLQVVQTLSPRNSGHELRENEVILISGIDSRNQD